MHLIGLFCLGDGNFAVVRICKDRNTGIDYALKIIDKAKCKEHYVEAEVNIFNKCKSLTLFLIYLVLK